MKRFLNIIHTIFGLIILVGILWFLWEIIELFVEALKEADAKVTASVIGSIATISVGLSAVLYTQNQIKQREISEAHRSKKVEIYHGFLEIIQRLMAGENENVPVEPLDKNEMLMFILTFKSEMILWSSPNVVLAYQAFELNSLKGIENLLPAVDNLYKEMRKDIGLSNKGLSDNQLVKMYLKDPSELDDALKKVSQLTN